MSGSPLRAARVAPELALQAVEPVALVVALVAVDDRRPASCATSAGARAHVDVEPAGDPLAQVAVQAVLDLAAHLLGAADDQPLHERRA